MKNIKAKGILWMVLLLVPVLNGILLLTNGKKIQCKLWRVGGLITLLMQVGGFALSGVFSFFNDDLMTLFLLISIVGLIVPIILGLLKIGLYRKRTLLLSYAEQCNIQFTDFIELQGKYDTYLVEVKTKAEQQRQEQERVKRETEIRQREQEEQARAAMKAQQEEAARREAEQRRLQEEANQREIEKQKQEQARKEAELRSQQEQAKREAELRKQQEQREAELRKQQETQQPENTDSAVSPEGEAGANKVQSRLNRIKK